MKAFWSDEVGVMLRPVTTYRQLVKQVDDRGVLLLLRRPLFFLFIFGGFVSFTTAGRLTIPLVFGSALFWSFLPVLQMLIVAGIVLIFARDRISTFKAIDLFFTGHGPWLLWFLAVAGICLFAPLKQVQFWPVMGGWFMPISLLGAFLWSGVTIFGFLRGALNMAVLRAGVVLLVGMGLFWGILLSYFFAMEISQPYLMRF